MKELFFCLPSPQIMCYYNVNVAIQVYRMTTFTSKYQINN